MHNSLNFVRIFFEKLPPDYFIASASLNLSLTTNFDMQTPTPTITQFLLPYLRLSFSNHSPCLKKISQMILPT